MDKQVLKLPFFHPVEIRTVARGTSVTKGLQITRCDDHDDHNRENMEDDLIVFRRFDGDGKVTLSAIPVPVSQLERFVRAIEEVAGKTFAMPMFLVTDHPEAPGLLIRAEDAIHAGKIFLDCYPQGVGYKKEGVVLNPIHLYVFCLEYPQGPTGHVKEPEKPEVILVADLKEESSAD